MLKGVGCLLHTQRRRQCVGITTGYQGSALGALCVHVAIQQCLKQHLLPHDLVQAGDHYGQCGLAATSVMHPLLKNKLLQRALSCVHLIAQFHNPVQLNRSC
jgi:hypothetical protein